MNTRTAKQHAAIQVRFWTQSRAFWRWHLSLANRLNNREMKANAMRRINISSMELQKHVRDLELLLGIVR